MIQRRPWFSILLAVELKGCPKCAEVVVIETWRFYSRPERRLHVSEFGRELSTGVFEVPEEHECSAPPASGTPTTGRTG